MEIWIYTLVSVVIVSCISLVGLFFLSFNQEKLQKILLYLVSFAVGGLFGDAFIHLIPESFKQLGIGLQVSGYILLGVLVFFVLEKFLRWRHCHVATSSQHLHPVATLNLVGDGVHNLIDGMIIGASYLISFPIGITTTMAVILHEIPQEIGEFGILVHAGLPTTKAITFNFLSALTAVLGAIISLIIGPHIQGYAAHLLPITAGAFIYLAGSDLIPELHGCEPKVSTAFWQFILIILGISIMASLLFLG